jgi:hypothetical protein
MTAIDDLPKHLVTQSEPRAIGMKFPKGRISQGFQAFLQQSREDGPGFGIHDRSPPFPAASLMVRFGNSDCMTTRKAGKEKRRVAGRQLSL